MQLQASRMLFFFVARAPNAPGLSQREPTMDLTECRHPATASQAELGQGCCLQRPKARHNKPQVSGPLRNSTNSGFGVRNQNQFYLSVTTGCQHATAGVHGSCGGGAAAWPWTRRLSPRSSDTSMAAQRGGSRPRAVDVANVSAQSQSWRFVAACLATGVARALHMAKSQLVTQRYQASTQCTKAIQ